MTDYIHKNRDAWNRKTEFHIQSEFYDMPGFLAGKNSLKTIELNLLGNISSKTILHLQCHFGQDTLSLARMGGTVTGVDLSDKAIEKAKALASEMQLPAEFICCNIYDLPLHLNKAFDVVFTSYGTIGWLPDIDAWAKIVAQFLKKGGRFIFADFHPVVWMMDNHFTKFEYDYFKSDPIHEIETGTYADANAGITTETVSWNHGLAEVITSLMQNGLEINTFDEYDYSPYNCFKEMREDEPGKFRIRHLEKRFPMMYSLSATKK